MNNDRRRTGRPLAIVFLSALAAGCTVGPDYRPPHPALPSSWAGVPAAAPRQPSTITARSAEIVQWWHGFEDPQLTSLIEQALPANLDRQLALARLREARAARGVAVGGLWPSVNGTASYQRERPVGASDQNLFQAGFDAVWELDIFGGVRRSVEVSDADIQAAEAGLHDVEVSLAAEVALQYVQLRGFQQQIVIAGKNLATQRHTAEITLQRFQAGFASALDVANADAQVATTRSTIPVLETGERQAIYALSVLLARPPAALLEELSIPEPLPLTPPEIPVGLPSDLLRRRPDIRQAEARLHSATAQIGVATADLFPKFSLTGAVQWQSDQLHSWFTDPGRSSFFGPAVDWAIFQGGSLTANVRVQQALRDQAFVTYQQTVLGALQDVENALVTFDKEWEHRQALQEAVSANRKAVDLATQLYTQGQTDFLNVLDAQRSLFASEDALVRSTGSTATDLITLYKALGGGWKTRPPPAPGDKRDIALDTTSVPATHRQLQPGASTVRP
jgi:multidrug efflux system outer membrane protein